MVSSNTKIFGPVVTENGAELGLKLFEKITYLEDYYLTNAEIETLTTHADKIAERLVDGSQLVELGSGYVGSLSAEIERYPAVR